MTYDNPIRYDLSDPNSDSMGPTAKMERHPVGDYVEFSEYETLLEAYNEACEKLRQIANIV